ncbi:helix-turn-helix domain-containing protein [Bradyrhizobium sp. USDA 4502]
MVNAPEITAAQVRAARGWLGWTQDELARRSQVSQRSLARFELGVSVPHSGTLAKIRAAFEAEGVGFEFNERKASGISFQPADRIVLPNG